MGATALTACGGSSGRTGGTMTILDSNFPDALDPALSISADGWQPLAQVYPGLLTFRHESGAAGARVAPALATGLPAGSADGRAHRQRLRKGLAVSQGHPVQGADLHR